jgi:expansin (peptidoglycan-binding protein)
MKRFIKVSSGALIEAAYVAKLSDDGSDTTITVNWDTAANGVETFTVTGVAGTAYLERLAEAINYSKTLIIDAANI